MLRVIEYFAKSFKITQVDPEAAAIAGKKFG